jgi:hypothetical protein
MNKFSIILLLSVPALVFPQITFEKTFAGLGSAEAYAVQQTQDDGYIVVGYTRPIGGSQNQDDFYVVKTDQFGDTLWTRRYGGSESERAYAILETTQGDYIIAGYSKSFVPNRVRAYMIKINSSGDTLWTKIFSEVDFYRAHDIKPTYDGGYILAGYEEYGYGNSHDAMLVKTDAEGDTLWIRSYENIRKEIFYSVQQTSDSGFIAAGIRGSNSTVIYDDFYLVKVDKYGYLQWEKVFSGADRDVAYAVVGDSDEGYMITGYTDSYGAGSNDFYLIKTDTTGDSLWAKTYGTVNRDDGYAMAATFDGNYILAGTIDHDLGLIKIAANGDTIWTRTYGSINFDYARSIHQTGDGGYIIAGTTHGSGQMAVYLIKTDQNGLLTGIDDSHDNFPSDFILHQNYPNPFNPETVISWQLAVGSPVRLTLYNLVGQRVATLVDERKPAGTHSIRLDASNLASGVYIYRLQAGNYSSVKKMILLK